jgi:hypothetical protein
VGNLNNFWGLWIYGEHATQRNADSAIKISDAGGGFTVDLTGQSAETLSNATDDMWDFAGAGGSDNTDLRIDLDGTYPVISSPTDASIGLSENLVLTGSTNADYAEGSAAANEFRYYDHLVTMTADPAASAEVSGGYFRVNKTGGSNGVYTINGLEGVAGSSYADEAGTFRGVYGRTYTNADATSTMRTAIGGEFSARASYNGGTEAVAESGTAFVGSRIWMAPYFTSGSVGNINNFWGLWIYGEHASQRNADAAIKISDAGGGFTDDLILQSGNKITNAVGGTITLDAGIANSITIGSDALNLNGTVYFVADDGDLGNVAITNSDELIISGFTGGISITQPLKIASADYTITIAGTQFNSNILSNSESITDLTSVWQSNTDNAIVSGNMIFGRSRGTEAASTVVVDADELGMIIFTGYDGTDYNFSSAIEGRVDEAVVAENEMGGALIFSTASEGSNTLTERLRLNSAGNAVFAGHIDQNGTSGTLDNEFADSVNVAGEVNATTFQWGGQYVLSEVSANIAAFTNTAGGQAANFRIQPNARDGTDDVFMNYDAVGQPGDANRESLVFGYRSTTNTYVMYSQESGTGVNRALQFGHNANPQALIINTDNSIAYGFESIYVPNAASNSGTSVADDAAITVTNTIMRMVGADADAVLDTDPAINDGIADGQIVTIQGTADGNLVTIADNVNTQLAGGVSMSLGDGDTITLMWDSNYSMWIELFRSDN